MFREAITPLISSSKQFEIRLNEDGKQKETIELNKPEFAGWEKHWGEYVDYLQQSAGDEPSNGAGDGLGRGEWRKLNELWPTLRKGQIPCALPRKSAITLLSLLPILENWDTWGCFLRARKSIIGEEGQPCHFPPDCQSAEWFKPFYVAAIDYDVKGIVGNKRSENYSLDVLGRSVSLEAGCFDLAKVHHDWQCSHKGDFFDYCAIPVDRQDSHDERYLYRCYSHFVDSLIQGLSGETPGAKAKQVFFLAYPLVAAGRLHFLQVALTPQLLNQPASKLWDDWKTIHNTFWTAQVSTALEGEMQRIALSAFQFAVHNTLRDDLKNMLISKGNAELPKSRLRSVVAQHLYHLFPIRSFQWMSEWHYAPHSEISGCLLGYQWREGPPFEKDPYAGTSPKNLISFEGEGFSGTVPKIGLGISHKIFAQYQAVQSVEQQIDYVEDLYLTLATEISLNRQQHERANEIIAHFVLDLEPEELQDLREGKSGATNILKKMRKKEYGNVGAQAPPAFFNKPDVLERYLFQVYGHLSNEEYLEKLRELAEPTLLEDLSLLFDTSLVKAYTHPGQTGRFFSGDKDDVIREVHPGGLLYECYQRCKRQLEKLELTIDIRDLDPGTQRVLRRRFDSESLKLSAVLERGWQEFVKDVDGLPFDEIGNPKYRGERLLESVRFGVFRLGAGGLRFFLPMRYWLDKWLVVYDQRSDKGGLERVWMDWPIRARFPLANLGTQPVKHLLRQLWLPFRELSGDILPTANVFEHWSGITRECCSLYVVHRNGKNSVRIREYRVPSAASMGDFFASEEERERTSHPIANSFWNQPYLSGDESGASWLVVVIRMWKTEE